MKNLTLTLMMAVVAIALLASPMQAATMSSELGILDLDANGGINPATGAAWQAGDTYRFIFATSTLTDAESSDIATYNTYVQDAADNSDLEGAGTLASVTWKAVASTPTTDAKDNISANTGTGESFWLLSGTEYVADDYADLWDKANPDIDVSETGEGPADANYGAVWTGTLIDGTGDSGNELGATGGTSSYGTWSYATEGDKYWVERGSDAQSTDYGLYGVSEELTVIPEPASLALLGLAGAFLVNRRRR